MKIKQFLKNILQKLELVAREDANTLHRRSHMVEMSRVVNIQRQIAKFSAHHAFISCVEPQKGV
jgi:hypothetical protein